MTTTTEPPALLPAPWRRTPSGTVAYIVPGAGTVSDYRDWPGHRYGPRRWSAAHKPEPAARSALATADEFTTRAAAVAWLLAVAS